MKVLFLHDCAFVALELGRELERRGVEVEYQDFVSRGKLGFLKTAKKLRKTDCDIIHAHYCRTAAYASYLSGKPYIVHCHGSDVRYGLSFWKKKALNKASKVFVATKDLFDKLFSEDKIYPKTIYLPTPVGPQFKDFGLERKRGTLYFMRKDEDVSNIPKVDWTKTIIVLDRDVSYEDMPKLLNQYSYFIDDHYPVLSKVSLEALGCGCFVIMWNGDVIKSLPEQHKVKNVVDKLIPIYEEVLES